MNSVNGEKLIMIRDLMKSLSKNQCISLQKKKKMFQASTLLSDHVGFMLNKGTRGSGEETVRIRRMRKRRSGGGDLG